METEPQIIRDYIATGKARLIYRHLLQLGDGSVRTAEASECAADQGQFWPMHDMLYARQSDVYAAANLDATLEGFAGDLGMDTGAFASAALSAGLLNRTSWPTATFRGRRKTAYARPMR